MKLGKAVKKITILRTDGTGQSFPTVVYREKRRRKKRSRGLKGLEKMTRNIMEAQVRQSETYLDKHERSNEKRRDGWLRDLGENVARANNKGMRKLKPARWFD